MDILKRHRNFNEKFGLWGYITFIIIAFPVIPEVDMHLLVLNGMFHLIFLFLVRHEILSKVMYFTVSSETVFKIFLPATYNVARKIVVTKNLT